MTIYLIQYTNTDTNESFNVAFSSITEARKELKKLCNYPGIEIHHDNDQGPIRTFRPKNQADVINLINLL